MTSTKAEIGSENAQLIVENWPMGLEATREQLKKVNKRLEQHRAALRLASNEVQQRGRSMIALTNFIHQAGRVTNVKTLLQLVLSQSLTVPQASMSAILLIDTETKELTLGMYKGLTPELIDILTGKRLGNGAMTLMPHLVSGNGALLEYNTEDPMERVLLETGHLTSLVSLPIRLGPNLMGTLLVGLQTEQSFSATTLYFLMALSQETAIILESLRLREGLWFTAEALLNENDLVDFDLQPAREQRLELPLPATLDLPQSRSPAPPLDTEDIEKLLQATVEANQAAQQRNTDLKTLNSIAETMNRTLDLSETLQAAVEQTKKTLQTDAAWLYLVDKEYQLEMKAHVGLSLDYLRGMQRLKLGEGIEGWVVFENKPRFVSSVAKDTHKYKIWVDKEKLHALAAVPITRPDLDYKAGETHSHVIGVLVVGKCNVPSYTWQEREVGLLTAIANQLAPAIDNARLYEELQEDEVGLRVGNEVLRSINDMLLEKNTLLEEFIQGDLTPALTFAASILQNLTAQDLTTPKPTTLTEVQQQNLIKVQKIVNKLTKLAQEASESNSILNSELGQTNEQLDVGGVCADIQIAT